MQVLADRLVVRERVGCRGGGQDQDERRREDRQRAPRAAQVRDETDADARGDARRQPRDDHAPQRLRRAAGEPLQRKRVGQLRADTQRVDVAQRVEPPDPGRDRGDHDEQDARGARRVAGNRSHRQRHRPQRTEQW